MVWYFTIALIVIICVFKKLFFPLKIDTMMILNYAI
jgi:hypothetical protein